MTGAAAAHLASFLLCLAGFCALAFATDRVQRDVLGRALARGVAGALRAAGWGALALAFVVVMASWGVALGLVIYSGQTTLAAGLAHLSLIAWARRRSLRARA